MNKIKGDILQNSCHSGSLEKYYEPANSYSRKQNFCHSEDKVRRISYLLKRFFAECKFPFDGNCVRPAQNDGKFLVPQCLSNLVSFSPLSLPSPSWGEGHNNVKHLADFGKCAVRVAKQRAQHVPVKNLLERSNSDSGYEVECKGFEPPTIQDFTYSLINLSTYKRKDCTTMAKDKNIKNLFTYLPIHLFTFKKLAAFTLAEVLITLGIIGVVAAMTIPVLMANYQEKQTVTKLKDTYKIMANAIRLAEEEYGDVEGWGFPDKNTWSSAQNSKIAAEHLKPFIKVSIDCGNNDTNGVCVSTDCYKRLNGKCHSAYNSGSPYKISLLNGTSVFIIGANFENDMLLEIGVDTNGRNKPNVWGRDLFAFGYYRNRGLVPYGHPEFSSRSYKTNCGKNTTGFGCAYYVIYFNSMNYLNSNFNNKPEQ